MSAESQHGGAAMRWRCRVPRAVIATQRTCDAAQCGLTPAEWVAARCHFKQQVFAVCHRVLRGTSAESKHQVVALTGAVLFGAFTLPPTGYSIGKDVHPDVLSCACASLALKLNYFITKPADLIAAWLTTIREAEQATATQSQSSSAELEKYIASVCTAEVVSACEFYVLEHMPSALHVVTPLRPLQEIAQRARGGWGGARDEVVHAMGGDTPPGLSDSALADRVYGELELLSLQYCMESFLSDVNLCHAPSVVALVCLQRAVSAQGLLPLCSVSAETLLPNAAPEEVAQYAAAVAEAHADLAQFYRDVAEARGGSVTLRAKLHGLSRRIRGSLLASVPSPVAFPVG